MERYNKNSIYKPLLILGCQRSGTTLLAGMLGRHSEINMLFESTTTDVFRLLGKKYRGNKLCVWRQIRIDKKSSKFGFLVNRIVNFNFFGEKYQKIRIFPTSKLSINDYLNAKAVIITIRRDKDAVVNSLVNRTPLSRKQAEKEFEKASEILDKIKDKAIEIHFNDLVNKPEETMKFLCDKLDLDYEQRMLEGPKFNLIYPNNGFLKEKTS